MIGRAQAQTSHRFSEEALQRGVNYITATVPGAGRGLALADLDGDGDADLVCMGRANGRVGVYENTGAGHFADRSFDSGIPLLGLVSGLIAFDYDADGDLDLYVSRWSAANLLLRNDGEFHFTNVTAVAGVGDAGAGTGCAAADYDGDGWLDLYVSNYTSSNPAPNRLYRNRADGTFENVAGQLGVAFSSMTWQAVFFDYDRDGDPDLYISNDKGQAECTWNNYLLRNDGGTFTDVSSASGAGLCIDSMGVAVGDFDGSGWQDLYCTNTQSGNPLLLNLGGGTFVDASWSAGVQSLTTGWGAAMFDYDNDGDLDLFVCNQSYPNRLYRNQPSWPCPDVAQELGLAHVGLSYCVAIGDIDLDGDQDLVLQCDGDRIRIYINHDGEHRQWVRLRVIGRGANTFGIGATVDVRTGAIWRTREVFCGTGYKSQNEYMAHVGLGSDSLINEIRVTWPGGVTRTITNMLTKQTWTLYPPERLGDQNQDGQCNLADFVGAGGFAACYTGPGMGLLAPGCEMMDFDGDGDVDLDDLYLFTIVYDAALDDCDDNGQIDLAQIVLTPTMDRNHTGTLDHCDADLNGDAKVDFDDLLRVIFDWGRCPADRSCPADLTRDGQVNFDDVLFVIQNWGS